MKLHAGAIATGNGAMASAEAQIRNTQGGYVIAGASGQRAAAFGSIQGGQGDVIAMRFQAPNGREVALAVAIGRDPRQLPGQAQTTLIGRAAVRRG